MPGPICTIHILANSPKKKKTAQNMWKWACLTVSFLHYPSYKILRSRVCRQASDTTQGAGRSERLSIQAKRSKKKVTASWNKVGNSHIAKIIPSISCKVPPVIHWIRECCTYSKCVAVCQSVWQCCLITSMYYQPMCLNVPENTMLLNVVFSDAEPVGDIATERDNTGI